MRIGSSHPALAAMAALCACAAAPVVSRPGPPGAGDPGREAFEALVTEYWDSRMQRTPERASILGDRRWNDRSSDLSAAAMQAELAAARTFLARFEAIDPRGFPEQEALTRTLVMRQLRDRLEEARLESGLASPEGGGWKMPVNQMSGIHLQAAQLPSLLPFRTARDYDDYATRLRNLPRQLDDTIANMRLGMAEGLMPPRHLLEKVAAQAEAVAAGSPGETPFARPLRTLPEDLPAADRQRIGDAFVAAIRDGVLPAYARFARFVRDEYAPRGRSEAGLWSLPYGEARYAAQVRRVTTTSLSPEAIHEIGLAEVARIEGQMLALARKLGHPDLRSLGAALEANPALRPRSREQILALYRGYIDSMSKELPRLFGRLPRAGFEVVPVESYREKTAAGAQYLPPAPDGTRPGRIQVNTGDLDKRKTITFESTAYHEGVPGHHLQIAIAQELPGLPPIRRLGTFYGAFIEGWALYSERLGEEVGKYQDPYSLYGHLEDEMLRAIRLVVDTGIHRKRWSREQAVQYFRDHSHIDEVEIQIETDRYIAWPGQALGYKIGQLQILDLREQARRALGERFDIRRFHDAVLGAGALPLDLLASRIGGWIAEEKVAPRRAER
jgi:uncharacterized protein (DUF885 family)